MSNLIGLDIGSSSIKVALIKRQGDKLFLSSIAQSKVEESPARIDTPEQLNSFASVIKDLIASSNIKERSAAVCLPEDQVFTKVIEMPQLSPRELSAALKYEIDQYIPMSIDKVKTDWEILGQDDHDGSRKMNVMLVAAPISLLEKYQKIITSAGLTSEVIETEIISAYRSLLPLLNTPYSNMIVHMGSAGTTVAIVRSGVIKMIFSVSIGGHALTRAVAQDLSIDMVQAENYKNAYGFSQSAFDGKIGKIITPVFEQIIAEIKKGLLAFREKNNNESIKQVILSGGSALIPGVDAYLTNALSTQVVIGSAFSALGIMNVPEELSAQAPIYNVVVGLAIRNLK